MATMKFNVLIRVKNIGHGTPDMLEILGASLERVNRNIEYAILNYTVLGITITEA